MDDTRLERCAGTLGEIRLSLVLTRYTQTRSVVASALGRRHDMTHDTAVINSPIHQLHSCNLDLADDQRLTTDEAFYVHR
jgi:hypothetical protein